MRIFAALGLAVGLLAAPPAQARSVVEASAPSDLSVTIYRDPERYLDEDMERDNPTGFAMISETRTVTLPAGESTIRFIGVAEGMVGVSAIVTGLPGGTIEKNRNAELLSPAALVNGALGNRVTITRSNPSTGEARSGQAIVRTRADGGLVLQTGQGFEAVRCAGLPEKLTFNRIPAGLSAKPVYSVNTKSETGGTYEVTLTYLAWGFDWQANYVATFGEKALGREFTMNWLSWLSLVNDNGQSFENARLQVVAGTLNIESDFEDLSDPPQAPPLRLTCYPFGSTATGSPVRDYRIGLAAPPAPVAMSAGGTIIVTGSRRKETLMDSPISVVTAEEENLGDLKLFRVPDRVDVSAKGMKQVAFLNKEEVKGRFLYVAECEPYYWIGDDDAPRETGILLVTRNEEKKGLGVALPQGAMTVFEPTSRGLQLAGETRLRDYARGQDVELALGISAQVFTKCARKKDGTFQYRNTEWTPMIAQITNANPHDIKLRLRLAEAGDFDIRFPGSKVLLKDGFDVVTLRIPAHSTRQFDWKLRSFTAQ
ncbi:MAG: hypothetical protein AAF559_09960 [Pseudomonadota bacterium]